MQPYDPGILLPVTHSHKNFTPSREQRTIQPTLIHSRKNRSGRVEYLSLVRSEHFSQNRIHHDVDWNLVPAQERQQSIIHDEINGLKIRDEPPNEPTCQL